MSACRSSGCFSPLLLFVKRYQGTHYGLNTRPA